MLNTIAKRYLKAILKSWKTEDLDGLLKELEKIACATKNDKFSDLMHSPYVSFQDKQQLLLALIESKDKKVSNLLSLLLENKRLEVIPYLCEELKGFISQTHNFYKGVVYAKEKMNDAEVLKIRDSLAKRLNIGLELICQETHKDEIALVIDGLDVEISFSNERFLNDLKSHILKAI